MKKTNSTNYRDWTVKARHDLEDARRLLKDGGYADTICFLAQQAAEKYLKAYLVFKGVNPFKTHHLEKLARDCARFEKRFEEFLDDCLRLSRYYIETRYPPVVPIEYTKAEAKKAIEIAEAIIEFVEGRLDR